MFITRNKARDSLECRMKELHDAINILRKKPELGDICFRVYYPDEDINLYKSELEKEARNYGYNIYFKPGNMGTKLGELEYIAAEYWG
jgi:hypothetical protein